MKKALRAWLARREAERIRKDDLKRKEALKRALFENFLRSAIVKPPKKRK